MTAFEWLKRFFMATEMPAQKRTEFVMPCPFDPEQDRILIIYEDRLTPQQRDSIRDSLQDFLDGDKRILVLDCGPKVILTSAINVDTSDASMTEEQRQALRHYWKCRTEHDIKG
jgi:hypothetical protein